MEEKIFVFFLILDVTQRRIFQIFRLNEEKVIQMNKIVSLLTNSLQSTQKGILLKNYTCSKFANM